MFKRIGFHIKGLTLIEMMVALLLSILIMGALITIYLAMIQNNEEQQALIKIEDQSRSVMQHMSAELHLANDFNCKKNKKGVIKAYFDQAMKEGTDGFTIEYFDPRSVKLIEMVNAYLLRTTNEKIFKTGDELMITDCNRFELLRVKSISKLEKYQLIEIDQSLVNHYEQNSEISHLYRNSYFVKKTKRIDKKGQSIYALYIKNEQEMEWVEGVTDLKIKFDVLENDALKIGYLETLNTQSEVMGVSLLFKFKSLDYFTLEKMETLYVSLQTI